MLKRLFSPRSIAVIGASRSPGKVGHEVFMNIIKGEYAGNVYPVSPQCEIIGGVTCHSSVRDISQVIDVAIITVPAFLVPQVLKECGEKQIPFAVILTAGFREIGAEGAAQEEQLKKIAQEYGIRLVGPNCLGFIVPSKNLNASFSSGMPQRGSVGFISQSGAMSVALLDWAYESAVGFSKVISIGNKSDINEVQCLEFFGADRDTRVILLYVESIDDGEAFVRTATRIAKKKPIIVLKAGTSEKGERAVRSHTGSLAGSQQVMDAAFRRAGIIRARTVEEFFDFGLACSLQPLPKGNKIAIITNAGGPGIMATDAAATTALTLPDLSAALQKRLQKNLPPAASVKNPIDVIGDAPVERFEHALRTVLASSEIDGALVILTPQVMTDEEGTARVVARIQREYKKPVFASFMGGKNVRSSRVVLEVNSIPQYDTPERAVRAFHACIEYAQQRHSLFTPSTSRQKKKTRKLPRAQHHPQIRTIEAEEILSTYRLPVLQSRLLRTERECEKLQEFPLVMKIASRDIVHKKASGGIVLDVQNVQQAKQAFRRIIRAIRKTAPHAEIEGVLVQEQLPLNASAREVIVGMKRDLSFGPILMVGVGGSAVEIFHDVSFELTPLSSEQAQTMIQRLHTAPLLQGCDTQVLVRLLTTLARISRDFPELQECDMNPVIVYNKGGMIVDVRMML